MENSPAYVRFAMVAMADLLGTIVVPAVLAGFVGKYLEPYIGSTYHPTAILLLATFLLTIPVLVKKVRQYAKDYQQLIDDDIRNGSTGR
jgi:hypothetical protein